jgi:hypothetical protein
MIIPVKTLFFYNVIYFAIGQLLARQSLSTLDYGLQTTIFKSSNESMEY